MIDAFCDNDQIAVVRFKDRFVTPLQGGWRDVTINYFLRSDERKHICEAQLVHTSMLVARKGLDGFAIYNRVRSAAETLRIPNQSPTSVRDLLARAGSNLPNEVFPYLCCGEAGENLQVRGSPKA